MFMSVALSQPPSTSVLTRRILQLQNLVEDLSSPTTTTYNNIYSDLTFTLCLFLIYINVYVTHFDSLIDVFYFVNILYYYASCSLQLLVLVY